MRKIPRLRFREQNPEQLKLWNREIKTRLGNAGLLPQAEFRGLRRLPPGLCQLNTARVRELLKAPCKWVAEKHENGTYQVHFVTLVLPAWMAEPGDLSVSAIVETRDWVARRLRKLGRECRYAAIGVVDVSFNDGSRVGEGRVFAVHAHVLLALKVDATLDATAIIKWAFNLGPEHYDQLWQVKRPRKVQKVKRGDDWRPGIKRVRNYMGRALFPFGNHMRVLLPRGNSTHTRDRPLNVPQLLELLTVLKDCPPERRIILSGFLREGDQIVRRKQTHPLKPTFKLQKAKAKAKAQAKAKAKGSKGGWSDYNDDDNYYDT